MAVADKNSLVWILLSLVAFLLVSCMAPEQYERFLRDSLPVPPNTCIRRLAGRIALTDSEVLYEVLGINDQDWQTLCEGRQMCAGVSPQMMYMLARANVPVSTNDVYTALAYSHEQGRHVEVLLNSPTSWIVFVSEY